MCPDKGGIGLCDISFDEVSVLKSLEKLRDDKAAGADELMPRFLNLIKQELACPLTILFQSIMVCECVPDAWKEANVELMEEVPLKELGDTKLERSRFLAGTYYYYYRNRS